MSENKTVPDSKMVEARTVSQIKTYSVKNPPTHSRTVIMVDCDPRNKTELIAGVYYEKGVWFGVTGREAFTIHPDSYWFEIPS